MMTTRTASKVTAQLAVELLTDNHDGVDVADLRTVLSFAVEQGVAKLYTDMLAKVIIDRDPPVAPEVTNFVTGSFTQGRADGNHYSMVQIMASNAAFYDCHTVEIGGHVLEDTHETRDGFPMSVVKSTIVGNVYYVTVDTNEYN